MVGRSLRARAPVSYNDKDDMVPAWMKTAGVDKPSSSGKENSSSGKGSPKASKEAPKKAVDKSMQPEAKKDDGHVKGKKNKDSKKSVQPAVRGRNAGVRVIPIGAFVFRSFFPACRLSTNQSTYSLFGFICLHECGECLFPSLSSFSVSLFPPVSSLWC